MNATKYLDVGLRRVWQNRLLVLYMQHYHGHVKLINKGKMTNTHGIAIRKV